MSAHFPLFPEQASTFAPKVDAIFLGELLICVAVAALVFVLILAFSIRYRRGAPRAGDEVPGSLADKIEFAWCAIPLLIFIGLFLWAGAQFFDEFQPPPEKESLPLYAVGKQWMWKVQHPEGQREINEIHVPVGRPIVITLTSQDVIHSLFIPAFRIKHDVVPGRYVKMWFEASRPGVYDLYCAQYCGTDHSTMKGHVVALSPADYAAWLASGNAAPTLAAEGERNFRRFGCSGCHSEGNSGAVGPPGTVPSVRAPLLNGIYGKPVALDGGRTMIADDQYLRDCILQPNRNVPAGYAPIMPTFQGVLSEEEIFSLIAYIKSLRTEP